MLEMALIYQDPLTKKKPEGWALLVDWISTDQADGTERWQVRFEGEDQIVERTISRY